MEFELVTVNDKETKVLKVLDFEKTLAKAQEIVSSANLVITNDDDKKLAKETRATFNKIVKAIDRKRIDDSTDFVSRFIEECNAIKQVFDDAQKKLGEEITAYEEAHKVVVVESNEAAKKYTATLKFTDPKVVDKLTKFATTNGCELTIK